MIEKFGIGIDLVDINEFKKIPYSTKPKFYEKIFHKSEIDFCLKYKNSAEHFAGKFALKEAVKKSVNEKISMLDIVTSHSNSKPTINLLVNNKKYKFLASISHEKQFAVGAVISEKI